MWGIVAPMSIWQTARDSEVSTGVEGPAVPGAVIVWSGDEPALMPMRLPQPGLIIGRELLGPTCTDDRISRQHARVRWNGQSFAVADLGSRNGTYAGGQVIVDGEITVSPPCVLRTGRTVSILVADIRRYEDAKVDTRGEVVVGPSLGEAWQQVERAARTGETLLLTGESGTGKELAARAFHRASGATGELIGVNCAAIPAGVAERLLFGAKKGAYSGADRDADGYLVTADNGTLFLDEIADLDLQVQAKLLRVLETKEVLPLGASKPRTIVVKVVVATLRDLRAEVTAGRFRDDLYYRIGRPEVRLPPLRQRLEEIPWLVWREVNNAAPGLSVHSTLIEACLVRPWPGNVRELLGEIRRSALTAVETGKKVVRAEELEASAGMILAGALGPATVDNQARTTLPAGPARKRPATIPEHTVIADTLRREDGNVTRAARALGLHRNQLRRYLARHEELAAIVRTGKDEDEGDDSIGGDPGD